MTMNQVNQTDAIIPMFYDGYLNDGTTVINADLPKGAVLCTVETASAIDTTTGLQKLTRPATAQLATAKKFVVHDSTRFPEINSDDSATAANKRRGGIIYVYNPNHPANQQVPALVNSSVSVGTNLVATDGQFYLSAQTLDASAIDNARVGVCRQATSGSVAVVNIGLAS